MYYSLSAAELFIKKHPELHIDIALNTDSPELAELVAAKYPEVIFLPRGEELGATACLRWLSIRTVCTAWRNAPASRMTGTWTWTSPAPCAPNRTSKNAFAKKQSRDDLDLVFSVCEARRNPWFNMVKTVDDHVEQVCKSEFTGRQQAPDVYDVNASIYVFKRDFLATNTDGMLWRGKIGISVMMDTGIIDIDSEHDYLLMEAIAQHLYAHYPEFAAVQENIRD